MAGASFLLEGERNPAEFIDVMHGREDHDQVGALARRSEIQMFQNLVKRLARRRRRGEDRAAFHGRFSLGLENRAGVKPNSLSRQIRTRIARGKIARRLSLVAVRSCESA
jgi:hypothetical protein